MRTESAISIKTEEELAILRDAGKILATIVGELKSSLTSGITTKDIDAEAEKLMKKSNVTAAFKGYRGFPGCICSSVNEEIVHGIPSGRKLKDGDILSIDVGIIYKEYYSDTAFTEGIGKVSKELDGLLKATNESLYKGIKEAKTNCPLSNISHAVQSYVEAKGYSVVREFVGHGIGKNLHENPEIPNFGPPNQGPILQEGMVLAIEPMVNLGSWQTKILQDGWTVVTQDGKPSAHFEHTIAITIHHAKSIPLRPAYFHAG